jgi:hypothetical protein
MVTKVICNICKKVYNKNVLNRKNNRKIIYKTCSKQCSTLARRISKYKLENSIDKYGISDPNYWLNFTNNNIEETIIITENTKRLFRYLNEKSPMYLLRIFDKINIKRDVFFDFIKRIKNNKIDYKKLVKFNNANSINRWIILGFDNKTAEKTSNYFKTTKRGFRSRGDEELYYKWKTKSINNRNGVPEKYQNPIFIEYWLNKGFTKKEASKIISDNNRRDLNYFIKKYDIEIGTKKYNNMCLKRKFSSSIEGYMKKYGEKEGVKRFYEISKKKDVSKDFMIKKYGVEIGTKRYEERIIKMLKSSADLYRNNRSKISDKFINELSIKIMKNIDTEIRVDTYICDAKYENTLIEFFGDWWHKNYLIYNDNKYFSNNDIQRIECYKKNGYNTIILWESAYTFKPNEVLNIIENFISNFVYFNIEINYSKNIDKIFVKSIERKINERINEDNINI